MKKLRFVIIGCGYVAPFHANVIRYLKHYIDIVVARKGSKTINNFAKKYGIKKKIYGISSFLKYLKDSRAIIDCILLCTPCYTTESILRKILPIGIPVISEYPVAISINAFEHLKKIPEIKNLFVAYNRRYYDFIPIFKKMVERDNPLCVDILLAEPYDLIKRTEGDKILKCIPYFCTSHMIDLMFYIFKNVQKINILKIEKDKKTSWICNLYSRKYKCPIQMKILMDCPQNSYFKVFFEKKVAVMSPFEKLILYNKLHIRENKGRATYLPVIKRKYKTSERFKPGFLNQMNYFIKNFVYKKNSSREYLEQLERVTYFCEELIKSKKKYG